MFLQCEIQNRCMGVPLDRDDRVANSYSVDALPKRKLSIPSERSAYQSFKPEPGISDADFAHMISDIGRVLSMFERLPIVHAEASEEHLRDQIIVTLNGIYAAGSAETFSKRGKHRLYFFHGKTTQVFIAECKWWRGEAAFSNEALPQLLDRYVVWRDTHTAMVLFIKNRDVSAVHCKGVGGNSRSSEVCEGCRPGRGIYDICPAPRLGTKTADSRLR